jgi:hypothetical protein
MYIKKLIRWIIGKAGYDIVKSLPVFARRKKLFDSFGINVVLDVGANVGLYAKDLRGARYKGRIVSFEPLSSAYSHLLKNKKADASWEAFNMALGDKEGGNNKYRRKFMQQLYPGCAPGSLAVCPGGQICRAGAG